MSSNIAVFDAFGQAAGLVIKDINLVEQFGNTGTGRSADTLFLEFTNGLTVAIYDEGQSCCEVRTMRTDDKLKTFIGDTVVSMTITDIRPPPSTPAISGGGVLVDECPKSKDAVCDSDDVDDVQFLIIQTNRNYITFASHNEHNGNYGGFSLTAKVLRRVTPEFQPKEEIRCVNDLPT